MNIHRVELWFDSNLLDHTDYHTTEEGAWKEAEKQFAGHNRLQPLKEDNDFFLSTRQLIQD